MRQVYPNHEIPHLWAHQAQAEARNSTGSLYFDGPTIYSYGSHFPIARHITNERSEPGILLTTAHYSVTTSGHCSAVARAIPSGVPVFRVPHVENGWGSLPNHRDNVESHIRRISDLLGKAKRARVHGDCYEREALAWREQLQRYVAFFDVSDVAIPASEKLDILQSWIAAHEDEERRRLEEKAARLAEERRRVEQAEHIERFRACDPHISYIPGVSPMLSIVGDEVQTSLGAQFPVSHAVRGLGLVREVRESGLAYERNCHTVHLGLYAIDRIDADGTVHAGCHVVKW